MGVSGTPSGKQHSAFDEHVVPQIDVLYRVALAMTGQPADAEDLVQDTLVRAFRAIDGFDGAHPRAWLLTILRNTHISRGLPAPPGPVHRRGAGAAVPGTGRTGGAGGRGGGGR